MKASQTTTLVDRFMESELLKAEWVLWFLLFLLFACVVIVVVKVTWFVVNGARARKLGVRVDELMGGGSVARFRDGVEELPGAEAFVLRQSLRYLPNGPDAVAQQMDVAVAERKWRMERGIVFLGTVGANAPFVGLFGTVLGVIRAFRDLSLESDAGASAVMAGIAEALVATAVGLLVAIPAVVAFNYLNRRVKAVVSSSAGINQKVLLRLRAAQDEPA